MKKVLALTLILLLLLNGCKLSPSPAPAPEQEAPLPEVEAPAEEESAPASDETVPEESNTITLVVPEGFTLARIGMRLEEFGVCTADEFTQASQSFDYSEFSLIAAQEYDPHRCFKLEGYLFPDTYEIYKDEAPESIITKMLSNTEKKINGEIRSKITASGYTTDQILTIASIIEKEAYERNDNPVPQEMPKIASVLYNRLDSGTMLQCNVTATYAKWVIGEFVENGFDEYNEYYNTYHAPALPPGAICNPGIDAIKAAIEPADTDYLFFLTDEDKNFYYSETYEEHQILVEKYLGGTDEETTEKN